MEKDDPFIFKTAKDEKVVNPPAKPAIQKILAISLDFNLKITSPANRTPSWFIKKTARYWLCILSVRT